MDLSTSTSAETRPRLELANVTAGYGGADVIHNVSLSVLPGEVLAVIGRNGVGKTTLLRAIMGQAYVRQGSIALDGRPIDRYSTYRRARSGLGYVPQGRRIFPSLTGRENLAVAGYGSRRRNWKESRDVVLGYFPTLRDYLGQRAVSASLLKTSLALMGTHGAVFLNTGIEPRRAGTGVSHLAPYGAYRTKDFYVVAAALNEESWAKLCRTLEREELVADPRFANPQKRLANREELDALLTSAFETRPSAAWIEAFEQAGLVIAPVNTLGQALAEPQVRENDMLVRTTMAEGELTLVGGPMSFAGWEMQPPSPPPALGVDTKEVLSALGYDAAAVARLQEEGVV